MHSLVATRVVGMTLAIGTCSPRRRRSPAATGEAIGDNYRPTLGCQDAVDPLFADGFDGP